MHISSLVSFLGSGGSSGAANLGQELNSVRTIGRSKDKERIGNLRGQVPVGEISPELRLPGFILVGDHSDVALEDESEETDTKQSGAENAGENEQTDYRTHNKQHLKERSQRET